jgi:FkbM family methyltransferase
MHDLSKYVSRWCRWAPDVVDFELTCGEELVRGQMHGTNAADHIVWRIWMKGAESYEAPLPTLFTALTRAKIWRMSRDDAGANVSLHDRAERGHVLVIGANSGFYALLAGLGDGASTVHAFEPFPPAFKLLRANVELNALQRKARLVEAAISNRAGETSLFVPPPRFETRMETVETSASLNAEYHEVVGREIRVPMLTVDDYAHREGGCGTAGVAAMLIDVEGFEHAVLEGCTEVLRTSRPALIFEVLNRLTTRSAALERIRQDHGYRCFVVESDRLRLSEPIQPSDRHSNQVMVPEEGMDCLAAAAALARLRINFDA